MPEISNRMVFVNGKHPIIPLSHGSFLSICNNQHIPIVRFQKIPYFLFKRRSLDFNAKEVPSPGVDFLIEMFAA